MRAVEEVRALGGGFAAECKMQNAKCKKDTEAPRSRRIPPRLHVLHFAFCILHCCSLLPSPFHHAARARIRRHQARRLRLRLLGARPADAALDASGASPPRSGCARRRRPCSPSRSCASFCCSVTWKLVDLVARELLQARLRRQPRLGRRRQRIRLLAASPSTARSAART